MPRKNRIWYENACFHVMARGNRRCAIFIDDDDNYIFMKLISAVKERYPFDLHAFCLMTNHFHILITTTNVPIWIIMQQVLNNYAKIFNIKYGLSGHLFESRYTSCIVEDERYFLEVSRYIHLNPVMAGIVRYPLAYEYSSYRKYISGDEGEWGYMINTEQVLGMFGDNGSEQYRQFVEGKISHKEQEQIIRNDICEWD